MRHRLTCKLKLFHGIGLFNCLLLCLLVFIQSGSASAQQSQTPNDSLLIPGRSLQRKIKVNETQSYTFRVEPGYLARIIIESKGIDLAINWQAPNREPGEKIQDNFGSGGFESILLVSDHEGDTHLRIVGVRSSQSESTYRISLTVPRLARREDQDRIEAEQLVLQGTALARQNSLESRRKALEKFQAAIPLLERLNDQAHLASVFNRIGRNFSRMGERQKAIDSYQKSLMTRREIGDRVGEAIVLADMGLSASMAGEFQKALDYYNQSLTIRRALNNKRLEAQLLYLIGNLHTQLGEPQKALDYFAQALPVIRATGDKNAEVRILNNIGAAYYSMGQLDQALANLDQCLELQRASSDRLILRGILWHLALVHFNLGHLSEALDLFTQALELEQQSGDINNKANILAGLGEVTYRLQRKEQARVFLNQALPLMIAIHNPMGVARVHYWLSHIDFDDNQLEAAQNQIEAAIGVVEGVRSGIVVQEFRASYFATVEGYYDFYIKTLWQLNRQQPHKGFDEKALIVSETSRARSLLELLNEAQVDIRQGVPVELLSRERELEKQLNAGTAGQSLLISEDLTEEQNDESMREIEETNRELLEVEAQIRQQSPRYASLTRPQIPDLKEIQAMLDENTILLEYKLSEPKSYLWAITNSDFQTLELAGRTEIEDLARRMYRSLTTRKVNQRQTLSAGTEYLDAAERLSQLIVQPITPMLKSERLLIVSDGALQYIPFAALPEAPLEGNSPKKELLERESSSPLIVRHEIVMLPSASIIGALRREAATREPAPKALAVFADPVFAKDDVRITSQRRDNPPLKKVRRVVSPKVAEIADPNAYDTKSDGPSITRLPFSRREANAIVASAPASDSYLALDFDANLSNVLNPTLRQYRILHFATHGWISSERPELSGLVLSMFDKAGEAQDGVLSLHEIYNLGLNADLVVLSACQTALGKDVRGEGLVGLTRGFMYAGAPRVAASLWKVDDAATAELMTHFYRFMLKEKLSPAASLRAAQLELIKQKRWHEPYFWAGFVLQGEWR